MPRIDGAKGFLQEAVEDSLDAIFEGIRILWEHAEDGKQFVLDNATGVIGTIKDGALVLGEKALTEGIQTTDRVAYVGDKAVGAVLVAGRFLTDEVYRRDVGIPWLKKAIEKNRDRVLKWMKQHREFMDLLERRARGVKLDPKEITILREYLLDLRTVLPVATLFLMPGGMVFLPLLNQLFDEILASSENSSD